MSGSTVASLATLMSDRVPGAIRTASRLAEVPVGAAGRVLPVRAELAELLPQRGLRRGSTVVVRGSTSVLLALLAAATEAGSWAAVVGMPELGLLAAAELGVVVRRLALVPRPGAELGAVVAALLDGLDLVVVAPDTSAVAHRPGAQRSGAQGPGVQRSGGPWAGAQRAGAQGSGPQGAGAQRMDAPRSGAQRSGAQRSAAQRSDPQGSVGGQSGANGSGAQWSDSQGSGRGRSGAQELAAEWSDSQGSDARWPGAEWSDSQGSGARRLGAQGLGAQGMGARPDRSALVRRLSARARHRESVLLSFGAWPGADLEVTCGETQWSGLGSGSGRLTGCELEITVRGRGAAARPVRAWIRLPTGPAGFLGADQGVGPNADLDWDSGRGFGRVSGAPTTPGRPADDHEPEFNGLHAVEAV